MVVYCLEGVVCSAIRAYCISVVGLHKMHNIREDRKQDRDELKHYGPSYL